MGKNAALYYEHEMKFSLKLRGMQLFSHLSKFFLKHRWLKGNKYLVEESESAVIKFVKQGQQPSAVIHEEAAEYRKNTT